MPVFRYKAVDLDASNVAGTITADSPGQARESLRQRGLTIAEIGPLRQRSASPGLRGRRGHRREVISFIRELATLLKVGIPLLTALQTLSVQHRRGFKAVLQQLADRVAAGVSLADAMHEQADAFDELCVSIVRVGENTGHLEMSLKRLADYKEKADRLRSRVTTALMYPAIVCMVGVFVSIFLMTYVVPNLLGTLLQAGKPLPTVTWIVKSCSDFLLGWWWAILAGVLLVMLLGRAILRTASGRMKAHQLLLRVPVLGELIRKENTSRMSVVMAALLRSGLPFIDAIRITQRTLKNRVFRIAMDDYERAVAAGRDVAGPLEKSKVFSPMVVQMLSVGQQSGQLEEMLEQLSEAYDQEVALAAARLTAVLEPLLIVLLAVMVGFIAFATILPILEVSNVL